VALTDTGDLYMWSEDAPIPILVEFFTDRGVIDVGAALTHTVCITDGTAQHTSHFSACSSSSVLVLFYGLPE
jgi:hypothetical protein